MAKNTSTTNTSGNIKTGIFYWLYVKYLAMMCSTTSLDKCKLYFKQAVNEASKETGYVTIPMLAVLRNIDTYTNRDDLIEYAKNMVSKFMWKLKKAGLAS